MLRAIVQSWTKIPAVDLVDGGELVADVIHILPPDTNITIEKNVVSFVKPGPEALRLARPIDAMFNALAGVYCARRRQAPHPGGGL